MAGPDFNREMEHVSSRGKQRLTKSQERRRMEGLRMLARIIARHYLANPLRYRNVAPRDGSASAAVNCTEPDGEKEGAA